jgi:hypothetical protein
LDDDIRSSRSNARSNVSTYSTSLDNDIKSITGRGYRSTNVPNSVTSLDNGFRSRRGNHPPSRRS